MTALIRTVAGIITLVLALGGSISLLGSALERSESRPLEVPAEMTRLVVDNSVGEVVVREAEVGAEPEVQVTETWGLQRPEVSTSSADGTTTLRGSCDGPTFGKCSTDWQIAVPAGTQIELRGDVGSVRASEISGDLDVDLEVGEVEVLEATSDEISVQVGVGSASVDAAEPPRRTTVRTDVGDASVTLPGEADYRVTAGTETGSLTNTLGDDPQAENVVDVGVDVGEATLSPR